MSTKKVLLGMVAGLAAGISIGILFSPDKGSNTRNKITKGGEDLLDGIEGKLSEFANMLMQNFSSLKSKDYFNDVKSEVNKSVENATDVLKNKIT